MRINIKDIKKGDHFWEKDREFIATEDATSIYADFPERRVGQHKVVGKVADSGHYPYHDFITFIETDGAEHYGPKLQDRNMYDSTTHKNENLIIDKDEYEQMFKK